MVLHAHGESRWSSPASPMAVVALSLAGQLQELRRYASGVLVVLFYSSATSNDSGLRCVGGGVGSSGEVTLDWEEVDDVDAQARNGRRCEGERSRRTARSKRQAKRPILPDRPEH